MYTVNKDLSIYVTRGDAVVLAVGADNNGVPYVFQTGEIVRFRVFEKKGCHCTVLQKDFVITEAVESVDIVLTKEETKIGEIISKPKDYWYEIELNPDYNPQTIVGYNDDGPKVFRLFPEGADVDGGEGEAPDNYVPAIGGYLPYVTEEDNGKTMRVVDGEWELAEGGSVGKMNTSETDDYAFAIADEDGNVAFAIANDGEGLCNFTDKVAREKLKPITTTDEYAYAVCDENGNVVFAITHDGEVLPKQTSGTAIDFYKCGLPVLALVGDTSDMTKEKAVDLSYTIKSPKGTAIATGTCSCKWQGSSSVRKGYPKRNYTIKLDNAVDATRAISSKDGVDAPTRWGEQKKYCLKANWIDPSAARNVVNAKLWGEIVASRESVPDQLAAAPNYGAIDGFPCIILINDEFEGLYTFNIPKDGWMFNMGEGLTEYVVCGEENGKSACGFYSTPTFVEDENEKVDYSIEYKLDDVADETVITSFQAAVNAVKNAPNSAEWESAVEPYFDINSAIDYYIFVCCISGHDNLRRNTLYATYDGVRWFISAYDLDTTYGSNPYGTALFPVKTERTQFYEAANGSTRHRLFELIYKYSKDKLKSRYADLRSTILSDENVWYAFNNFVCNIPRAVYNMDAEKWADKRCNQLWPMPATTTANVENYIQYYRMHTALLDKEMED